MDVESVLRLPAPVVRPYVPRYHGYRHSGGPPGIHTGLPGPTLTTLISLADPIDIVAMPTADQAAGRFGAFTSGLHAAPATIAHDGSGYGVHLDVTPLGARMLLGRPAADLGGHIVDLADVFGTRAGELVERLRAAPDWPARFALLDAALAVRIGRGRPGVPAGVVRAWQQIVRTGGTATIAGLAADVGWSRRHLSGRFRAELGVTPKTAARIVRFDRVRTSLLAAAAGAAGSAGAGTAIALSDLAVRHGYFDQAHMAREWRDLAGHAPTEWLRDEFPFVQAVGSANPED